jgi:pyridinium-3,5-biscarboxylic acid mononucleotide sulfurtransferase
LDPRGPNSSVTFDADLDRLRSIIGQIGPMIVAYSGGVDSAFLAKVAHDVLGDQAVAVTAVSPSLPASQRMRAAELARAVGIRHVEIESGEMDDPRYAANPSNRCYFCKSELFERIKDAEAEIGRGVIVYGANVDDLGDFRPGMQAAREAGIRAPLIEAGLTKDRIRSLSRELGLPTWDAPSQPCLSSRIPHGIEVTPERLAMIERAEEAISALGFRQFRVRYHHEVARIEIDPSEMGRLLDEETRRRVGESVTAAGFRWAAVDLLGYRQGSLNPADPTRGETGD